jgi:hypothetical protein
MEEVNARLQLMANVLNKKYPMHEMLAEELCYFQLRMLCETFACALLVAHGKITGLDIDSLKREHSASTIFKSVRDIYENTDPENLTELGKGSFYPIPYEIVSVTDRVNINTREGIDFLTASEFLGLYGTTHAKAHRGALMFFSKRAPYVDVNFQPIIQWANKLANLLFPGHLIQSPDRRVGWLVVARPPQEGGGFQVIEMATQPSPPSQ